MFARKLQGLEVDDEWPTAQETEGICLSQQQGKRRRLFSPLQNSYEAQALQLQGTLRNRHEMRGILEDLKTLKKQ